MWESLLCEPFYIKKTSEHNTLSNRASEMAQWERALATKALSLIPQVPPWKENLDFQVELTSRYNSGDKIIFMNRSF